ncbi:hypothetical protein [Nitrososphaera viennensis]|uniref:Uncharacterized protein n=2 Tax=Nitrososphaera viennensis TaxID=1034015 RepID=A0A060HKK1_9ARCH|nr:hypothetical protein [Nitrososphaera viennensis]AIC17044.1 membrane protein of unknown function [Nitrososphaera viennensis EN76]UVS68939.1 hypothetical protein NWT39_13660 [Nitrososphaera viennensis]
MIIAAATSGLLGLTLVRIGGILALVFPAIMLVLMGSLGPGGIFPAGFVPAGFLAIFFGIVVVGAAMGILAFKFRSDIIAGKGERTVHTIILGAVMFFPGSNIAGALVAIGGYLCYSSVNNKNR